ncbi:RAB6-interacting golgin-like isoform X2 [Anastrepha obliqua]|uniref:RAB6-interacting golgin-like isoform X2 n=1 Tax=Anastrepha obliqua TaxID=95512 RepID=UPI002409CFB8|nr:RAB6-interacting golgin-like isoform X2 [Anastrepha obliqua]
MSNKFDGFSQDEINKVSGVVKNRTDRGQPIADAIKPAFRGHHGGIRRMPEKGSRSIDSQRKQIPSSQSSTKSAPTVLSEKSSKSKNGETENHIFDQINLDDSMSKSLEDALFYPPLRKPNKDLNENNTNGTHSANVHNTQLDDSSILKLPDVDNNVNSTSTNEANDSSILPTPSSKVSTPTAETLNTDSPFKGVSLREFETQRKLIEEQNKHKKELLCKAIELHSQKTAAEARKIAEIKQELAKLDNDLALDVSILRKQIDNACIYFSQVEKQYIKIEAQFLKAKIDLHNAAEKKELLTEHLCTVIAHNEDRKAQKLSELMQKVGLTETGDLEVGGPSVLNGGHHSN